MACRVAPPAPTPDEPETLSNTVNKNPNPMNPEPKQPSRFRRYTQKVLLGLFLTYTLLMGVVIAFLAIGIASESVLALLRYLRH